MVEWESRVLCVAPEDGLLFQRHLTAVSTRLGPDILTDDQMLKESSIQFSWTVMLTTVLALAGERDSSIPYVLYGTGTARRGNGKTSRKREMPYGSFQDHKLSE